MTFGLFSLPKAKEVSANASRASKRDKFMLPKSKRGWSPKATSLSRLRSGKNIVYDVSEDIGEANVLAVVTVSEFEVIKAQKV